MVAQDEETVAATVDASNRAPHHRPDGCPNGPKAHSLERLFCVMLRTATKRMLGRLTASQMAAASAASFFCRRT
jgi:hypothetical protein